MPLPVAPVVPPKQRKRRYKQSAKRWAVLMNLHRTEINTDFLTVKLLSTSTPLQIVTKRTMGLFKNLFNFSDSNESLIEVSNDNGDHWVASVPAEDIVETSSLLINAGVVRDHDDQLSRDYRAAIIAEDRDHKEYRFRTARVVDGAEDLELNGDLEDDRTRDWDREPTTAYDESQVPKQFRWWC